LGLFDFVRWIHHKEGQAGDTAIVPLSPQSDGNYANGFSGNLTNGDYTLVVTDRLVPVTDLTDLRSLAPSDISNCVTGFSVSSTAPVDTNPGDSFLPPTGASQL
jgi:hypothetical protein